MRSQSPTWTLLGHVSRLGCFLAYVKQNVIYPVISSLYFYLSEYILTNKAKLVDRD